MTVFGIYLIGIVVSAILLSIHAIWYLRDNDRITLTNVAFGIFMLLISWGGAALLFITLASFVIDWLYEEGDNIIIWKRKSKKK